MNKRGLFIVIALTLFLFPFVLAQAELTEEEQQVEDAYQCLEDNIGTSCGDLTPDEKAFSILALGDHEDCVSEFLDDAKDEECWPSNNCKLKETSIALLALDRVGKDTSKIEAWLLNQTKAASDLTWFVEIDADLETSCNINYDNLPHTVQINEDKTIDSSGGNCLPISSNGYWLEISSNCLEKEFTISCDQDFKTTLLYRTQSSSTIHVSQNLNSASANSEVSEKVTFKCFEEGTACNYEGSLWGSIALNKKGLSTAQYFPYLDAFSQENKGDFPEAFLYILTSNNEFYTRIIQDNFNGKYWQVGNQNKLYNTALALLAIGGQSTNEEALAKTSLLEDQETNGCFGNTRDTAFILYTAWPRDISTGERNDCTVDADCSAGKECVNGFCKSDSGLSTDCEAFGEYCEPYNDCLNAGGNILDGYTGCSGGIICCSVEAILPSCNAAGGHLCSGNEECPLSENLIANSDGGTCCTGFCELPFIPEPEINTCENAGGNCKSSCLSGENEDFSYSCGDVGGSCCMEKKGSLVWVWVLLALIIIVVIAIIFRNKLKLLFSRIKSKFTKKKPVRPRPMALGRRPLPPRVRPHVPRQPPRQPPRKQDKDFEDTLKKLKEMGK